MPLPESARLARSLIVLGSSIAFASLGCWGQAATSPASDAPVATAGSTGAACAGSSPAADCEGAPATSGSADDGGDGAGSEAAGSGGYTNLPSSGAVDTTGAMDDAASASALTSAILAANCGPCHGSALSPASASAGINYIADLDRLVSEGLIVPLDSSASDVVALMRSGAMPPPASGLGPVSAADIDFVAAFIDAPAFW
jgi:hypothetical protein